MSADVPEGWEESRVEKVVEILDSKRVPLNSEQRVVRKGQIPYWGANGVVDYIDDYIFDEPLILMAEDGGYFSEARYRPICHRLDGRAWVNNHAHVMRPLTVERDWFYYWFVHRDITPHIKGGTRTKLNQKDLRQLPILLPPLPEQRRIAEILSSVDDAIAATQAVIDQTRTVKQGVLKRLLTKGIGHTRFKQTEIGEIPEEWEVVALSHYGSIQTGKTPSTNSEGYWGGHIPFITPADLSDGHTDVAQFGRTLSAEGANAIKTIPAGAVMVTCIGSTIGKAGIATFECGTNQQINTILCDTDVSHFVYELCVSLREILKNFSGKQAVPIINKSTFSGIKVPFPPRYEQVEIARQCREFSISLDALQRERDELQTLKSALMSDLLTGRKRVSIPEENVAAAE